MNRNQVEPLGIPVAFRNDSGETIPPYGIIKITNTVKQNGIYLLKGEKPDAWGSQYSHYVNGPAEVADGDEGRCYVPTSPVWAAYDTGDTPAVGEPWGPTSGSWELSQDVGGFEVISSETDDGKVLVIQRPMLTFVGKTDASHSKSATGTISIYAGSTMGSESDTTVNKTGVYNRYADLDSGKWVTCRWVRNDQWELVAGEC